jgi:hypothetical protein
MSVAVSLLLWFATTPDQLVLELGSESFRQRELSETRLLSWRGLALPAILRGRQNPSTEIARRCEELYPKILKLALEDRIRLAFQNDPPTWSLPCKPIVELPALSLWKKRSGTDSVSEKAYFAALKDHPDLFLALETDVITLTEKLKQFCQVVGNRGFERITPSELDTLLFFSSILVPKHDSAKETQPAIDIREILEFEKITEALQASESTTRIFTFWCQSARERAPNRNLLDILSLHRISATGSIALGMAHDAGLPIQLRCEALIAYASIVTQKKEILQLLPFLNDETEILRGVPVPGHPRATGEVQVRDVALGALSRSLKLDPDDFGFEGPFPIGGRIPKLNSYAFVNQASRKAAHEAFQKWLAKNLRE